MSTLNEIRQLICEKYDIPEERLSLEQNLEELGMSSLDLVELIFFVEEKLGIRFSDMDSNASLRTVQDVVNLIDSIKARTTN